MLADRDLASAQETAAMIAGEGGVAECVRADWTLPVMRDQAPARS